MFWNITLRSKKLKVYRTVGLFFPDPTYESQFPGLSKQYLGLPRSVNRNVNKPSFLTSSPTDFSLPCQ